MPKEILIEVRRGDGVSSPHVLDLRARGEEKREEVKKKENPAHEAPQAAPRLSVPGGDENWMKEKFTPSYVLERRPSSLQFWRRGSATRTLKHRIRLNFYRRRMRAPEEQVADLTQEGVGVIKKAVGAGNWLIPVLVNGGVYCGRGVRWVWAHVRALKLRPQESRGRAEEIEAALSQDFDPARGEHAREAPQDVEEEIDEAPVALWRRAEVVTLVGLTFGLLIAVKAAGVLDEWKSAQGVVLGEAAEGVQALVSAHEAFARADMPGAIDSFLAAQERFTHVSETIDEYALASVLGAVQPFKSGVGLVHLGEKSAQAAEHVLLGLKSLDDARGALSQPSTRVSAALQGSTGTFLSLPLPALMTAADELKKGEEAFDEAMVAAAAVREEDVPEAYRPAIVSLKAVLPPAGRLLAQARVGAELLVSFFGASRPRRFLVVFQNDAELRPTGGFLGSYAVVDTDHGNITSLDVPGGGFYDLKGSLNARVDAPYPFHLFSPHWQSWNANWFFDFPSSARTIGWFIEKSQGPTVDGVIAITPVVLEDILALTGPVVLPEYDAVIDERNVRRVLQDETEQNYDREKNTPKQIIADLVPIIIQRLPVALGEQPAETLTLVARALDRHDILVWSSFPEEQRHIEEVGWGGAVAAPATGDYLAVVHTNVGGGKTDKVFEERWTRTLALTEDGEGVAKLEMVREHKGNQNDFYEKVHHVDYVRVFVPRGSTLLTADGFEMPDEQLFKYDDTLETHPEMTDTRLLDESVSGVRVSEEHGLTTFGGWIMTKAGEASTLTLTYRIPHAVQVKGASPLPFSLRPKARAYSLTLQRQPGALHSVFTDTVLAPKEWGASTQGDATQKVVIDRDQFSEIVWEGVD